MIKRALTTISILASLAFATNSFAARKPYCIKGTAGYSWWTWTIHNMSDACYNSDNQVMNQSGRSSTYTWKGYYYTESYNYGKVVCELYGSWTTINRVNGFGATIFDKALNEIKYSGYQGSPCYLEVL